MVDKVEKFCEEIMKSHGEQELMVTNASAEWKDNVGNQILSNWPVIQKIEVSHTDGHSWERQVSMKVVFLKTEAIQIIKHRSDGVSNSDCNIQYSRGTEKVLVLVSSWEAATETYGHSYRGVESLYLSSQQ